MKIVRHGSSAIKASKYIRADEFNDDSEYEDFDDTNIADDIDDLASDISDIQDNIEGIDEDDPTIEIDNNIEGKYIAECDRCGGIFISAIPQSDLDVDHIHGVCPLCEHETDQYLNWVVTKVDRT